MSSYQDTSSPKENPAFSEKQCRENWLIIQGLAFGLMLGIMTRAAWDQGIISAFGQILGDMSVGIWIMLQDLAGACFDFFKFVMHSANS